MISLKAASFKIVAVDASNAHYVGDVFRSIYGEDYPVKDVYQPDVLLKEIGAGRLMCSLVFNADGEAAGYASMFKTAPNPRIWEAGNMIVVPVHAKTDIAERIVRHYADYLRDVSNQADGIYGEAVCSHYYTQVTMNKMGMVDCAIELDQLDGTSFKDGKSNRAGSARISCVFNFLEHKDLPEPQYVPARYEEIVGRIAAQLHGRTLSLSREGLPVDGATTLEDRYHVSARTWKVAVCAIGADWRTAVDGILEKAGQRGVISLQVTVNMACPHIGAAVDVLRGKGFFFGGIAPRWFGTDGLLMQRISRNETEYDDIKLYTATAKELLGFITTDREMVEGARNA